MSDTINKYKFVNNGPRPKEKTDKTDGTSLLEYEASPGPIAERIIHGFVPSIPVVLSFFVHV